jgi:hypothetical protein
MTPESLARIEIDSRLEKAGWVVQDLKKLDLSAGLGVAVREYPTDGGPADYVLFVARHAVGVIEAKRDSAGENLTATEAQTERYASARLKWRKDDTSLRFLFEATGQIIRFTDGADPAPRSREIFHFFKPETLAEWLAQPDTLRGRLAGQMPALPEENLRDCQIGRRHRAGTRAGTQQAPRPGAYGHRRGQDLYRHHLGLSPAQVRWGEAHPVSGGYPQSRQAGPPGVHGLHATRRWPQVHRALQRPAARLTQHRPAFEGVHQHHPAHVRHPQWRADRRIGRGCLAQRGAANLKAGKARPLQPGSARRNLRFHHHRRVPPQHLQPVEAGARLLRCQPGRPHRHPRQAHLRLLQREHRRRIHLRAVRSRRRQRRLRRLHHRNRDHPERCPVESPGVGGPP